MFFPNNKNKSHSLCVSIISTSVVCSQHTMAQKSVVLLHLKAIGEAPALKNAKFKIDGEKTVADVEKFLQKQLKYEGALFLFCGSGFSPTPDQKLQTLFDVR